MIKASLLDLFVALLMVGFATAKTKDDPDVETDSHPSDTNSTTKKKLAWIRAKEKLESQMATDKLNSPRLNLGGASRRISHKYRQFT